MTRRVDASFAAGQIAGALAVLLGWLLTDAFFPPVSPWVCAGPVLVNSAYLVWCQTHPPVPGDDQGEQP